jgi:hypothetical protein
MRNIPAIRRPDAPRPMPDKAVRFSTGVGRVKKQRLTIAPSTAREWLALAAEARAYAMAQAR